MCKPVEFFARVLPASSPSQSTPSWAERATALTEVLLCSGYPTQLALGATFTALGYRPRGPGGELLAGYVATLSLLDSVVLIVLILLFLRAHGERPREVFAGTSSIGREAMTGVPLALVAIAIGAGTMATLQWLAPALHTVSRNPLEDLLETPGEIWLFAVVAVVAGGLREELQRAFLLRRFEVNLGGAATGVVLTSLAFGAGHLVQGVDAALTTGILGAFWAIVYLRRRSVAAPVVSHSGFNLLEIVQFLVTGR